MRGKTIFPVTACAGIVLLALSSCFSPYRGEGGNLVIDLSAGGRAVSSATVNRFSHTITVSGGPGGPHVREGVRAGDTVAMTVAPGDWTISVKAYLGGVFRAEASKTQTVRTGRNNVDLVMNPLAAGLYRVEGGNYVLESAWEDIAGALDDILVPLSGTSGDYLLLAESDTVPPISLDAASLTIQGYNTDTALTLGNLSGSMFSVGANAALTLDHITLKSPSGNNEAALVTVQQNGTLVMNAGSVIRGNSTRSGGANFGGGVSIKNGNLTMNSGSAITGNQSSNGGGVYISGGNFTMNPGSLIDGNTSTPGAGGGVYVDAGTITLNGTIFDNEAGTNGGGVCMIRGEITAAGTISDNKTTGASYNGGGVYMEGGKFTLKGGGLISGNSAPANGGGVYVMYHTGLSSPTTSPEFIMEGGTIGGSAEEARNTATLGGGVYMLAGTFTMTGGGIIKNTALEGGGLYFAGGTAAVKGNALISENTATSTVITAGGGGVHIRGGSFTLDGEGSITKNTAYNGAGVYIYIGQTFTMESGTIADNIAEKLGTGLSYGGGVNNFAGQFFMRGGTIARNKADHGGGVYKDTLITNPPVNKSGGIIYGRNGGPNSNIANISGAAVYHNGYAPNTHEDTL